MCWPGPAPARRPARAAAWCRGGCTAAIERQLADTASGGQEVLIDLQARRFFCGNDACAKATFAEQVPGLTTRYGRRTCGLQAVLQAVALALGGRAGARLTGRLACAVSRSTLLRLIRAAPTRPAGLRWCWASMTSRCARGMSTAPCWSISRPAGRWTCSRSGPRSPSAPGWTPTRARRSSAGTAAAATPKAPRRARRWPSRSPTGGICGTTWPKPSSVPSPATAPACKNHHRNPNPGPRRRRPRRPRRQAWPRGPGPGTPRFTPRWPAG